MAQGLWSSVESVDSPVEQEDRHRKQCYTIGKQTHRMVLYNRETDTENSAIQYGNRHRERCYTIWKQTQKTVLYNRETDIQNGAMQ